MGRWQSWGGKHQLFLCNFLVCEANQTFFQIEENTNVSGPLAYVLVPIGQVVSLGASSTPSAFKVMENQLFLTVIPDYEVRGTGYRLDGMCPLGDIH